MVDLEQNKRMVQAFLEMTFNAKQPAEAFSRYVAAEYIQHNPQAPNGWAASVEYLTGFVAQFPQLRLDIRRIIAESDFVVTHLLVTTSPDDRGSAVADIVRIDSGKIVEHWDVVQAIPERPANDNTML